MREKKEERRKTQKARGFSCKTTILCLILSLSSSLFHVRAFILSLIHLSLVIIVELVIVVVAVVVFVLLPPQANLSFFLSPFRDAYWGLPSPQPYAISCLLIL